MDNGTPLTDKWAREKATHQQSARVLYNTLEEMFPPKNTEEYWANMIDRMQSVYVDAGQPLLLRKLMVALFEYFDELIREEEKAKGEPEADGDG